MTSRLSLRAIDGSASHYDNIRANITYSRLDSRGRGRVQLVADVLRWPGCSGR